MRTRKVSIMAFINDKWEIMIQKRWSYSKNWEDYAFFGGWIDEWESHEEALIREMREELNLDIDIGECIYLWEFTSTYPELDFQAIRNIYIQHTWKNADEFEVLEWEAAQFVTINEARLLKFPTDVTNILDLLETFLNKDSNSK